MRSILRGCCTFTCITALSVYTAPAALAQTAEKRPAQRTFDIAPGSLAAGLKAWARATRRSVLFRSADVVGIRTAGVRETLTDDAALDLLLTGTGFGRVDAERGAVAVVPQAAANTDNATPEILVTGSKSWSLNTGVERSQDDSQPFIVMTRDEIRRSGAPNLETFLRNNLNVNTSPQVSEQATPGNPNSSASRGLSSINLRGLGSRDTLILVDGRRQPGVNIGSGTTTQASITGIPIAAIERIEVLASSASGIYGSGASGGVINIVLKRDFTGGELSLGYGNTADFAQGQGQIDLTYGMPLEGGRTRVAATATWRKTRPLLFGDRRELRDDAIETLLANNPAALTGAFVAPPSSTTVNYKTSNGRLLQLKPGFGGTTLGSNIATVPAGFRGIAIDGVTPLLAGVGRYNFEPADNATPGGTRYPLLFGSEQLNGSLTLRREFNDRISGYVGVTAGRSTSVNYRTLSDLTIALAANARNNPFVGIVNVSLPGTGIEARVTNRQNTWSLVGGAIVRLPASWQMALDLSYARNRFESDAMPPRVTAATISALRNGTLNVLRDVTIDPLAVVFDTVPFSDARTPALSSTFAPSLRLAGPIPVSLPGGKPQMTVNMEYSSERMGESYGIGLTELTRITYVPASEQKTWSAYGEVSFPLIGRNNNVPFIQEFELRLSARAERYQGDGSEAQTCDTFAGPLPSDYRNGCPTPGVPIVRSRTTNSHIDPSISLRWRPFDPLVLRGSYTTGYLPPTLSQLVRQPPLPYTVSLLDRQRGDALIGTETTLPGYGTLEAVSGGNPDILPESSSTLSAGAILTPGFAPGLRFSADWTRIRKRNVYFDPAFLGFGGPLNQQAFDLLLAAYPQRATRGAPSDGFSVGPITALDISLANLLGTSVEAIDFVINYEHALFGGTVNVLSRATYVDTLLVESFPGAPAQNYAGVVATGFASGTGANGSLRWSGSAAVNWTGGPVTFGWQGRYIDSYALNTARSPDPGQGSAYVKAQLYNDVNFSYRLDFGVTLTLAVNNVMNRRPPLDISARPNFYSPYADPRLRNFMLLVRKSF